MNSIVPYAEQKHSHQTYYQRWVLGADLYQKLASMPQQVIEDSGMSVRYGTLIGQWIDPNHHKGGIKEPGSIGPSIDLKTIGDLDTWIRQAKTLVHYIEYDDSQPKRSYSQTQDDIKDVGDDIANSVNQIPGYSSQWHWPWIEGWDDPKKRKSLLKSNKKGISLKNVAITVGVAGAAIWIGSKFFGKKENPQELEFQESDFE